MYTFTSFAALLSTFTCSHDKSISYYIESINGKCPFTAYPCNNFDDFTSGKCLSCNGDSCSVMGFHADKFDARGDLYLFTNQNGTQPFCSTFHPQTLASHSHINTVMA